MVTNLIAKTVTTEYSFQSSVYSPTGVSDLSSGAPTVIDFTMDEGGTGLSDGAAINSDKLDLVTIPLELNFKAAIEYFAAISAGGIIEFWWSESGHSGDGIGNPGKPDGVDGLYTGDGGGTVAESVRQMTFIEVFLTTDLQGVQIAEIGTIVPKQRYGQLVMFNESGTTVCGTDDIESAVLMSALMPDIQAAA